MMTSEPLVTIYIPCRNYGKFLRQSVESVFNQSYSNWELIIIDEASDDDTIKIAESVCKLHPNKTFLIKNNSPMGLQKLANHVLNKANGKYMMRLDADDWLDESALYLLVSKLENTNDKGIVYGNYYYTDQDGKVIGVETSFEQDSDLSLSQIPPHGACTLFRTRALKSVGGYSEDVNAQDGWDLWYKISNRIGSTSIRTPIFYYRQHNQSLSKDNDRLLKARSKIFENAGKKLEGDYKPSVLAVIPVKESYPDLEGVPFMEIDGKSLLEHTINNAQKSKKINQITVMSESEKVLKFSKELENDGKVSKHRVIKREKIKKNKNIPIRDFMNLAGEDFFDQHKLYPDIIIFLSIHAINRNEAHIDKALNALRITEGDSVVSVQEERNPMFSYNKDGLELINPGRFQDLIFNEERLYRFNGCLIATWWEVLKSHSLFGEKISFIEMSNKDSFQIKSNSFHQALKKIKD